MFTTATFWRCSDRIGDLLPEPSARNAVHPQRIAEIRRQIADGSYWLDKAEDKLEAVVDGLWRDLRSADSLSGSHRAAG